MKKERKPSQFLSKPIYVGGQKAMRQFIANQLSYPQEARDAGIEGTVKLRYDINYQGEVVGAKVLKSLGHGCDEEAIRLVHMLKFKVAKVRKVKVLFHKTINIHFRLPAPVDTNKAQPGPTIRYSYTPSKSPTKTPGYHYSIQIKK